MVLEMVLKWRHSIFLIISPLKGIYPFFQQTWISPHPRMIYAKFNWNLPSGSGEEVENENSYGQTDTKVIKIAYLRFQYFWTNIIYD